MRKPFTLKKTPRQPATTSPKKRAVCSTPSSNCPLPSKCQNWNIRFPSQAWMRQRFGPTPATGRFTTPKMPVSKLASVSTHCRTQILSWKGPASVCCEPQASSPLGWVSANKPQKTDEIIRSVQWFFRLLRASKLLSGANELWKSGLPHKIVKYNSRQATDRGAKRGTFGYLEEHLWNVSHSLTMLI